MAIDIFLREPAILSLHQLCTSFIKFKLSCQSPLLPNRQAVDMCITTTEFILPIIAGVYVNIFTQTLQTLGGNGHLLCYQEGNNLATTRFMIFIQELQIIKSTHKSCSGIGDICSKSNTYTPGSGDSNEYILYSTYTLYFYSIKNNIFNIYIPSLIADSTTV